MVDVVENHFEVFVVEILNVEPCDRFTVEFGPPGMWKLMFSSVIARLNDAMSRFSSEQIVLSLCVHLSSCKPFSSISWEQDVSPLTTNTSSVPSGFPDRSQIGLGFGWVSWENVARWISPQDCRTILPTGCCSIVEPNCSFPQVQLWSCLNEIFGGGRGDKYGLSYKTSPVLNLTTIGMQEAGSVPWRIIAFDHVW